MPKLVPIPNTCWSFFVKSLKNMPHLNFHETPKSSFCLSSFTQKFHKTSFMYNTHLPQPTKFNKFEQLENTQTWCETRTATDMDAFLSFSLPFFPFYHVWLCCVNHLAYCLNMGCTYWVLQTLQISSIYIEIKFKF